MVCKYRVMILTVFLTATGASTAARGNDDGAKQEELFALIVTNNRSLALHRPDLQYADDDGARYYRTMSTAAPAQNIRLLTRFDASSRKLYPELAKVSSPPTIKNVTAAVARLAREINEAKKRGAKTRFYFVFAGHGDVEDGRGYLEMSDGRFGPDQLESVVEQIDADIEHLILDSCNSFFMIAPRGPGGRVWATPEDLSGGFVERHPNVGLALSTSAAAQTFEWSEIQSGIFSHEIRSALTGAADVDGDGHISYGEIEAFIHVANKQLKNERFAPKVFVRGPGGHQEQPMWTMKSEGKRTLELGMQKERLWLTDENGVRIADVHKEEGFRLSITLPVQPEAKVIAHRIHPQPDGARPTVSEIEIAAGDDGPLLLDSLERTNTQLTVLAARGYDSLFATLFAEPFGKKSYEDFLAFRETSTPEVFGIGPEQAQKMELYLGVLAEEDRRRRKMGGASLLIGSGMVLGAGVAFWELGGNRANDKIFPGFILGLGVATAVSGIVTFVAKSDGEKAYDNFTAELAEGRATMESVTARTEKHLDALARTERRTRWVSSMVLIAFGGSYMAAGGFLAVTHARGQWMDPPPIGIYPTVFCAGAMIIAVGIFTLRTPTKFEKILDLYRRDQFLKIGVSAGPARGSRGATLSLVGRF
jgi:hypothetical protein